MNTHTHTLTHTHTHTHERTHACAQEMHTKATVNVSVLLYSVCVQDTVPASNRTAEATMAPTGSRFLATAK